MNERNSSLKATICYRHQQQSHLTTNVSNLRDALSVVFYLLRENVQSVTFSVSLKNVLNCHSIENTVSGEKGRYRYVVLIVSPLSVQYLCVGFDVLQLCLSVCIKLY